MLIKLDWPDKHLSPNARVHWAMESRKKRVARTAAYWLARESGDLAATNSPLVALKFCPPDNRHRDLDNMIASLKSALDGIADAIKIDDSKWRLSAEVGPVIAGGKVFVTVTP